MLTKRGFGDISQAILKFQRSSSLDYCARHGRQVEKLWYFWKFFCRGEYNSHAVFRKISNFKTSVFNF